MTNVKFGLTDHAPVSKVFVSNYGLLATVDTLGQTTSISDIERKPDWLNVRYNIPFPEEVPYEMYYAIPSSGRTLSLTYDQWLTAVQKYITIMFNILMSTSATLDEFTNARNIFNDTWSYYVDVANLSGSALGYGLNYNDTPGWNQIVVLVQDMKNQLNVRAGVIMEQDRAMKNSTDAAEEAISYYTVGIRELSELLGTSHMETTWQSWLQWQALHEDEQRRWDAWKVQITDTAQLQQVGALRSQWKNLKRQAQLNITRQEVAKAEATGTDTGEVMHTTQMRTGLWSKQELDYQSVVESQIDEAVAVLNTYTEELRPALTGSLNNARQIYDAVTPKAKAFNAGVSLAVSTHHKYLAAIAKYNEVLTGVEARFRPGAKNVNWALVLGVGVTAAIGIAVAAT